jgi:glycosyltransferase involved in cell wall biosynthesis
MGRRSDIGSLMSAMDIFVLPSLYEGLPVVCVESATSALPTIISQEAYVKELESFKNVNVISLEQSASDWAQLVLECIRTSAQASRQQNLIAGSHFDIDYVTAALEKVYLNN